MLKVTKEKDKTWTPKIIELTIYISLVNTVTSKKGEQYKLSLCETVFCGIKEHLWSLETKDR